MSKIGIFGAGSIGCYIGGRLAAYGQDVTFLGRTRMAEALNTSGVTLTHFDLPELSLPPEQLRFVTDPQGLSDCDMIIVTVKSSDTEEAAGSLREIAKPDAAIVSLQNGIGNTEILSHAMPDRPVFAAMIPNNVAYLGQGHFHMGTEGTLLMEDTPLLRELATSMRAAGIDAQTHPDMRAVQWGKLLMNLSNAINTLGNVTIWEMLRDKDYRWCLSQSIREALSVLEQAGIVPAKIGKANPKTIPFLLELPNPIYHRLMPFIIKVDKTAKSSMAQDMAAGRARSEIDALNGEVIALARKMGKNAPINQWVTDEIKRAFASGKSPAYSGAAMRRIITSLRLA